MKGGTRMSKKKRLTILKEVTKFLIASAAVINAVIELIKLVSR